MEKIIFGITSLTLGGAERVLVDIANKLVEKYDITIFTIYSNGELEKELNEKIHLKSIYNKRYDELTKKEKRLAPLSILINQKKIYRQYIDNEDYKAQIAFLEGPVTRIFSTKSTRKNRAKKITWIHNDISKVFGRSLKSKIKRIIDRGIYEKYDTLVFVSLDNLDKFNKVYDDILLPHERVIYNYINADRILSLSQENEQYKNIYDKNEINIVQVSRLVEQKAIDRLIKVHAKLIKEGLQHHIYIVGDGPQKDKLNKLIKENNVEKTFTLLGAKKNPYPYIKDADYFCLFSNFEGYPMVVEEAKILKKYIATTNTAAREVLLNYPENSIIVNNDEEGIEKAIKELVNNKKQNLSKPNNYKYENDKIIDKIIKILNEANKYENINTNSNI